MTKSDFKKLSAARLREAKILLKKKGAYSGAYYICGYSLECALKACIAGKTRKNEFPDIKTVSASHTHDLEKLMKGAGLEVDLDNSIKTNPQFGVYWTTVKDWSEESRYKFYTKQEAEDFLKAVDDPQKGVLKWIKNYW